MKTITNEIFLTKEIQCTLLKIKDSMQTIDIAFLLSIHANESHIFPLTLNTTYTKLKKIENNIEIIIPKSEMSGLK